MRGFDAYELRQPHARLPLNFSGMRPPDVLTGAPRVTWFAPPSQNAGPRAGYPL